MNIDFIILFHMYISCSFLYRKYKFPIPVTFFAEPIYLISLKHAKIVSLVVHFLQNIL